MSIGGVVRRVLDRRVRSRTCGWMRSLCARVMTMLMTRRHACHSAQSRQLSVGATGIDRLGSNAHRGRKAMTMSRIATDTSRLHHFVCGIFPRSHSRGTLGQHGFLTSWVSMFDWRSVVSSMSHRVGWLIRVTTRTGS